MPYITLINGEVRNVRQATEADAWAFLHGWTHSGPDAVKEVQVEVPADVWSDVEVKQITRTAGRIWEHRPQRERPRTRWTRENCGARRPRWCTYPRGTKPARLRSWARTTQDGRAALCRVSPGGIPARWRVAFLSELHDRDDNERYRDALRLSVATFGVRFATELHSYYPASPEDLVLLPSELRGTVPKSRLAADV